MLACNHFAGYASKQGHPVNGNLLPSKTELRELIA